MWVWRVCVMCYTLKRVLLVEGVRVRLWPFLPLKPTQNQTKPKPNQNLPPPSALCIAAIACLSKQESARTGNALGLIGVTGGVVATLGGMEADAGTYAQVCGGAGAVCDMWVCL